MKSLENTPNNQIGQRIKYLLIHNRMNQRDLADKAGITYTSLSRYINGERTPNSKILAKIATALNIDANFLLGINKDIEDPEKDFYKTQRLTARSADKWTKKQKADLILAIMGVNND